MGAPTQYSTEVRERAVRMVLEQQHEHGSQWAAMGSVAAKIGCTAETMRKWVRRAERDSGQRCGMTGTERGRLEVLFLQTRPLHWLEHSEPNRYSRRGSVGTSSALAV